MLLMVTVISTFALSCSSDDDNGGGGIASEGVIVAKVNNSDFSSLAEKSIVHYGKTLNSLYFYGYDKDDRVIGFEITGFDGSVGTWEISESSSDIIAFYDERAGENVISWEAPYVGSGIAGELIITEFSSPGVLKGTFHFKGEKKDEAGNFKNVTNGSFNLPVDEGF